MNGPVQRLTERQKQVLCLLGGGLSEKEIAAELEISPSRVTQHVRALKDRLGTESRRGLVAAAKRFPVCEKLTGEKITVPDSLAISNSAAGATPDETAFADAVPFRLSAPWESDAYRNGLGAFDGPGETQRRLLLMIKIALGLPAVIVLLVVARWALTAAVTPQP